MINSKTLGRAVGISQKDISGNTGPNVPLINNQSVIIGRFKRGRTDKPFKVTADNFKALLGEDQNNDSFLVVQDAFIAGAEFVWVMRIGSPDILFDEEPDIEDEEEFEDIALESDVYAIPIYEDNYKALITPLGAELRSKNIKPANNTVGYSPLIAHMNITTASYQLSYSNEAAYRPGYEVLSAHLGLGNKKLQLFTEGYGVGVEPQSLYIVRGNKSIRIDEGYLPGFNHLDINTTSSYKSKELEAYYTASVTALDATSGGKVSVIDANIGTDGYTPDIALLDLKTRKLLIGVMADQEGYGAKARPLNARFRNIYNSVDTGANNVVYSTAIDLLDIEQKTLVLSSSYSGAYVQSVAMLDIDYSSKLAGGSPFEIDSGAYQSNEVVLSDIKRRSYTTKGLATQDSYQTNFRVLNVLTTQRIL